MIDCVSPISFAPQITRPRASRDRRDIWWRYAKRDRAEGQRILMSGVAKVLSAMTMAPTLCAACGETRDVHDFQGRIGRVSR